ncbi:MAG: hypothetical protein NZL95_05365 [Chitinophagales bacterium]|nr:hypothetical protein [Chitinophagales bacterium]MDW8427963.1 hypothetical protein [Chitinophagales bacterium]
MKKTILGLAILATVSFASCKSGSQQEDQADTTELQKMAEEGMAVVDSLKHEAGKMLDTARAMVDTAMKKH